MSPERIIFIRHAEEHDTPGIMLDGEVDAQSLTERGWQRAGALVGFFCPKEASPLTPDAIFASSIAPGSESKRPQQTVAPLLSFMQARGLIACTDTHAKPDTDALMSDVMVRSGTVLIAWEHSRITDCIAALPSPPRAPGTWPSDRYDFAWVLDRKDTGWTFTQVLQCLLAGDSTEV